MTITVDIYNLLLEGGAFQNNLASQISSAIAAVTAAYDAVDLIDPLMNPNITEPEHTAILALLTTIEGTLTSLETHTDRISGASYATDGASASPDIMALLSVATSVAYIDSQLDPETDTSLTLNSFFGSMVNTEEHISTIYDIALTLADDIETPPVGWTAAGVTADLSTANAAILASMVSDNTSYSGAIVKIRRWSMASFLGNPQELWRDFVIESVASEELADLIPEIGGGNSLDYLTFNPLDW